MLSSAEQREGSVHPEYTQTQEINTQNTQNTQSSNCTYKYKYINKNRENSGFINIPVSQCKPPEDVLNLTRASSLVASNSSSDVFTVETRDSIWPPPPPLVFVSRTVTGTRPTSSCRPQTTSIWRRSPDRGRSCGSDSASCFQPPPCLCWPGCWCGTSTVSGFQLAFSVLFDSSTGLTLSGDGRTV